MPSRRISKWYYVYVLLSKKDNNFYIGCTSNLKRRIEEHNAKKNFSTKGRVPLELIYAETCLNEEDAKRREKYLKTTQGRRLLKLRLRKFLKNIEKFI
jgi:putative endonuclease